jgi:hypothetical protein
MGHGVPLTPSLSPMRLCRNGDRGQRASFGSFRIAVILRLWATILIVESDVCMVNKRMILFTKRLRPKAPSAAPLSPVQFADRQGIGFISCQLFIVTQSQCGEGDDGD